VIGEVATHDTSARQLAEMMVGRPIDVETRRGTAVGAPAIEVSGLRLVDGGRTLLDGIDLTVRVGEVVGIAGVAGNGQRELAESIAGIVTPAAGSVRILGTEVSGGGAGAARRCGLAFVPEDRLGTGLVPGLTLTDNMLLTRSRSFFVDRRAARKEMVAAIDEFEIKTPGTESLARVLSGGNAQKLLLARELAHLGTEGGPQVIIVSSPTRGLDVAAAEFVRGLLHDARMRGCAVLIISEDLEEVRSLADRVAVLYRGRVALEGPTDALSIDEIGLAMAGVSGGLADAAPAGGGGG
jgi:simple sugar transport system ATP-binding protein